MFRCTIYLLLKLLPGLSKTLIRENLILSYLGTKNRGHYTEIGYSLSEIFFIGEVGVFAGFDNLKGKIWVTRENLFVDLIACGWLIRRFVDKEAVYKFVHGPHYVPEPGEIRFDMFEGEYTHEGDLCTFEVMIQRLRIEDRALVPMAEVVHDIDLKDGKYGRSETDGFNALLTGLVASQPGDEERIDRRGYRHENYADDQHLLARAGVQRQRQQHGQHPHRAGVETIHKRDEQRADE